MPPREKANGLSRLRHTQVPRFALVLLLAAASKQANAQESSAQPSDQTDTSEKAQTSAQSEQRRVDVAPAPTPPVWLVPRPAPWPRDLEPAATREVLLVVTVDASGAPVEAVVEGNDVPTALAAAAREFTLQQRFQPATRAGQPVAAHVRLAVQFLPAPVAASSLASSVREPVEAVATPVEAQPADSATTKPAEYGATAALKAGTGDARPVAASDFHIEPGALHDVPRPDAMQLVTLAPGIVLTNHSGEGHAYAAYLRGFSAGEGQDLEVRVQGIPINEPSNSHGHGYADSHFLIPSLVHEVRVLQGPFDARQGDFAAAGTVEFQLAAREPGVHARAGLGSFGRRQGLLSWSPSAARRDTFAAVELTSGDGFGPNRAHDNVRALAQYAGHTKRLDYRLFVASHALRFDSAGVIRDDALRRGELRCGGRKTDDFYCLLDPNQGGQATRHLLSSELRGRHAGADWSLSATWMHRTSRFRENFTGALLDPRGDGLDQQTRVNTFLAKGHYRAEREWRELPQTLELGYEGRFDVGSGSMWRVRREGQVPYASVFDHELALTRVSVYALAELSFLHWLSAGLGARADTYGYDVLDRDRSTRDLEGERLPQQNTSAWGTNYQPRVTLTVGPLATLSWINSFGIGSRSSDAAALSEGERAPFSRIWAAESGLVSAAGSRHLSYEARTAFFYAYVDRDMVFDETRGRNVPLGATNRYGAYAHGRVRARDRVDASASFTWSEAYQADGASAGFAAGPRLPFVPRFVLRGDATYYQPVKIRTELLHLRTGGGLGWVGSRPLPLEMLSKPIFSLDASLHARYRMLELSIECLNLTDRKNRSAEYYYASDFGTGGSTMRRVRHFSAAPPRTFMASLALHFDLAATPKETP